MSGSVCALNVKPTDGSCLDTSHVALISQYTATNSLTELKQQTNCSDDICILEKVNIPIAIKSRVAREAFKPQTTSFDDSYWLNNTEIDTVMSQLRKAYPGSAHSFIHMIDLESFPPANLDTFDYPVHPLSHLDLAKEFKHALTKQTENNEGFISQLSTYNNHPLTSFGIIFNTDTSQGSGAHWFALFISTDQKDPNNTAKPWIRIELFNSAGGGTTNDTFNKYWEDQAMNIGRATSLRCTYDVVSSIRHQSDKTGNCGSYSLFYIYSRLNGAMPSEFNNPQKTIKDASMQRFRRVLFQLAEK